MRIFVICNITPFRFNGLKDLMPGATWYHHWKFHRLSEQNLKMSDQTS